MTQQSIFGRVAQLVRADITALVDQAEDKHVILDQMIGDYMSAINDAESAIQDTIGTLRMIEADARSTQAAAARWRAEAVTASRMADDVRAAGDTAEADRLDNLARLALRRQINAEADAMTLANTIADEDAVADRLKDGVVRMRVKLDDLRRRREELGAQIASGQLTDAIKAADVLDPASEVARFEAKVRREESRIRGDAELAASTLDILFEPARPDSADAEVEARLIRLKAV